MKKLPKVTFSEKKQTVTMSVLDFLEYFELKDRKCHHEEVGTRWVEGTKEVVCRDCREVIYRGRGGPSEDDIAYGC